jgi:formylglycine-generating enzyme required for sulfatase activity
MDTSQYIRINAGKFWMGSPDDEFGRAADEAHHTVTLIRPLHVKSAPVTQAEWVEVMGYNPSICQGEQRPVEKVSWFDAVAYCNALSRRHDIEEAYTLTDIQGQPGQEDFSASVQWLVERKGYRLPTEAEWEYLCRASTQTAFYNGPCLSLRGEDPNLDQIAWYQHNANSKTHPVGLKAPNHWGLHDMLGNVWEWCWDWYGPYGEGPQRDPCGPSGGFHRALRGGAWYNEPRLCRAAQRYKYSPLGRRSLVGFRPVRSLVSLSGQSWRPLKTSQNNPAVS